MTQTGTHHWGPRLLHDGRWQFGLWAPSQDKVLLDIDGRCLVMKARADGWHSVTTDAVKAGARYRFRLSGGISVPDPASRFQPDGVFGPSALCDPSAYRWHLPEWKGRPFEETVLYELHIGTFTRKGTFESATAHLPRLADTGFTALEIMPLAQFPGKRGWGYDGVYPFAPHDAYGAPDEFKRFVDMAHRLGLMVFLDVVYNHFGPEGNFLSSYAPGFFLADNPTPWGPKIDFSQDAVRQFFIANALYWLEEYHLDGLRFDATDHIEDASGPHILEDIAQEVRARIPDRHVHLVSENAVPASAKSLFTAAWNDDFHHAMHVAVTGETGGHYEPYSVSTWDQLRRTLAHGRLREPTEPQSGEQPGAGFAPAEFVHFLQNHDQVGNRALGERLHTQIDRATHRVLTEILLLSPHIPLFFMGDDHLTRSPFFFFADYDGELADAVAANRPREASNFGGLPPGMSPQELADPNAVATFEASIIDRDNEDEPAARAWTAFLKQLFDVRRRHIVPHLKRGLPVTGTAAALKDGQVSVDWALGDVTLCLRANLSQTAYPSGCDARDCVYPVLDAKAGENVEPGTARLYVVVR